MKKWMLLLSLMLPVVTMGADFVAVPSNTPIPAPAIKQAVKPVAEEITGFYIDGPDTVEEGKLLRLRVKGVDFKIDPENGLRIPNVQWGTHPKSEDMEIDSDGCGVYLSSQEAGKSFWFVASVNNPDPAKAPLMAMKLVTVTAKATPNPKPPGPGPGPAPPSPDNSVIPDDQFDNVGKLVNSVTSGFPLRKETAEVYRNTADRLEDGTYPSINAAAAELQSQRKEVWGDSTQWPAFQKAIEPVWNKYWANPSKEMVIEFYRCVAKGLDP